MLFHLFNSLRERIPGANVFRYVSTRIGLATLTSLVITFMVAPWFIRRARERQLGELIRDDGPAGHASKRGTPTMGGALIIMALTAATVLWCDLRSTLVWLALLVTVGYGAIGFLDDYLKLSRKNKKGLPGKAKLAGQLVIGAVAAIWLYHGAALPFTGDVGAPALGGAVGFVALATKTELSLPLIGGVFVVEALSDIIQVGYYKRTKKRIFLMAPIHHHFEKLGWPESRIVVRFWIVSFACAILGLITTLKVR